MYKNKTVLAVIPARGGSKGLPGKNVRLLKGRPLIAWSVKAAHRSKYIDRTILSSDDQAIIDAATAAGCEAPFRRPDHLASDEASSVDVVRHAIDSLVEAYDFLVLLQPTSPLRTETDIDACIESCIDSGAPSAVSVTVADKHPNWMFTMSIDGELGPWSGAPLVGRRQDLDTVYALNGAVYVVRTDWFRQHHTFIEAGTIGHIMPKERSFDIDDLYDFLCVEAVVNYLDSNEGDSIL